MNLSNSFLVNQLSLISLISMAYVLTII